MAGQFFKNVIEGGEGVESGVVSDGRYFQMIVAGVGQMRPCSPDPVFVQVVVKVFLQAFVDRLRQVVAVGADQRSQGVDAQFG